jgi:osmotically-inducible protein OsmY
MVRSKEDIYMDLIDRLARDSRVNTRKMKIEIKDATVVLKGCVQSLSARDAAEAGVWLVKDVNSVENNLVIEFPESYSRPSDQAIKESVNRLMNWDPDLYLERIDVFVENGRVVLEGAVKTYGNKMHAQRLAGSTGGVIEILNRLLVIPSEALSDEVIGRNIISKFSNNSIIDINSIYIEVKNGMVTLSGIVKSRNAFEIAEDMVRYTDGVVKIENKLVIAKD